MILVTGGSGFIGSHVLDRLSAAGKSVRALVRRKTDLPAGVQPFFADLSSGAGLEDAIRGVSTIIHIAGAIKALRRDDYYRDNARATERLARSAASRGIRFVQVS